MGGMPALQRDLRHRLKNTLAVAQAIAHQTMRSHPAAEEFVPRFDGRLEALASAHSLLSDSNWEGADLAELIRKLLARYSPEDSPRYRMEGQPFVLPIDLATPLAWCCMSLRPTRPSTAPYRSPVGRS